MGGSKRGRMRGKYRGEKVVAAAAHEGGKKGGRDAVGAAT